MDFKAKFNKAAVLDFLKNQFLPEDFDENLETIKFSQLSFAPDRLKEIEYIGESPSLGLKLYVMRHDSESDPRVMLSRETFRVMSNLGAQRALVVYHSAGSDNYRLSLATVTLALKGAKTKREYSNPRRYSFFLGPEAKTHTPEQFLSQKVTDYNDLLNRFSIEVVNKEFYNEIAVKFTELVGGQRKVKTKVVDFDKPVLRLPGLDMSKPESHITAQEFAVRLIGRIVFCWFLKKKKSPAGVSLLPESVLSSIAVAACEKEGDNYYHTVLENFFFQVLNTEISERGEEFTKVPYNKIPFLNGGLFEPHDGDFYEFDSLTACSRHSATLKISNEWFKGLLQTLETYNFTIDENTSVDVELAVDPEMLGRIFENLLAEINPATGETARKSTGSYYTPRPIVEYMVDESLKAYLKNKTAISDGKLADLLSYSESDTELSEPEKEQVIAALDEVKIIDPACGSGAFPMGMLQKIVLVLQKVDPDSQKWLTKLLDSVPDPTARALLRNKLEGEADLWNYTRKLGVIRKSIYGVDIQPIAVEISKLRFFLSLVVDEKVDDKKKNRAIEPLPNLEFKFVCANTLIGLPKDEAELFDDLRDIDALKNLRDKYFTASGTAKLKVENEFLSTQHKMLMRSMGWGKPDTKAMKLSQWTPFKNKSTGWFDTEWMFGLKDGFDIVIANPPYVFGGNAGISSQDKKLFKETYFCGSKKINLFTLFIEKGTKLTRQNGVLSYIVPNTLLRVTSYDKLREHIVTTTQIKEVVDLDIGVFENVTASTIILSLENSTPSGDGLVRIKKGIEDENATHLKQRVFENEGYILDIFSNPEERELISKLFENSTPLVDIATYIRFGVVITKNIDKVVGPDKINGTWKEFLEGDEIGRYSINYRGRYLHYSEKLLHRSRTPDVFESPKIMIQRITGGERPVKAAFDDRKFYNKESILNLVLKNQNSAEYKFVLAVLNSTLINWFYRKKFTNDSKLTVNLSKEYVGQIPIKLGESEIQRKIVASVDKLLSLTSKRQYFSDNALQADAEKQMRQIDKMIFAIYGLTAEEISVIEKASQSEM